MTKIVVAQNGVVINIVNALPDDPSIIYNWPVADATVVNVGDVFDPKDFQVDAVDKVVGQALFNHENRLRDIVRAIRGAGAAANTSANNEGLPTTANSQDVTAAQFRNALKSLV